MKILCISSYFKGEEFMRAAHRAGAKVYLITSKKLDNKPWPRESLEDIFYIQQLSNDDWKREDLIGGMAWLFQTIKIDRIVALDDFDVEKAALLREHFRIPGMGQTTCRHFRDKLAMRMKAQEAGIKVPAFSPLFNNDDINFFTQWVSPPWLVKPRSEASATGITKIQSTHELWELLGKLGNERHRYLIEQFRPGDVYHADALTLNGKVLFCRVSRYLSTPMDVAHGGGIFRSMVVPFGSTDDKTLQKLNTAVMEAFGMQYSASHTEFIRCHEDGQYYFLETSSRVGGANLAEMVEASSGINLWAEWAKIEIAVASGKPYKLPTVKKDYAGIIVSLARQEYPDTSSFTDSEICWRMNKEYHIGLIVKDKKQERVLALLDDYANRVKADFHASAPVKSKSKSD